MKNTPQGLLSSKTIIGVIIVSLLLVGGIGIFSKYSVQPVDSNSTSSQMLTTTERFQDIGDVSMKDGNKKFAYTYVNASDKPIELNELYTSCMCTKSRIEIDGKQSAFAGMKGHGSGLGPINPRMSLQPNQEMKVVVEFDPNAHGPAGVGPISRSIYVGTNDSANPQLEFTFKGVVTK